MKRGQDITTSGHEGVFIDVKTFFTVFLNFLFIQNSIKTTDKHFSSHRIELIGRRLYYESGWVQTAEQYVRQCL